jgi:hypothetical protein
MWQGVVGGLFGLSWVGVAVIGTLDFLPAAFFDERREHARLADAIRCLAHRFDCRDLGASWSGCPPGKPKQPPRVGLRHEFYSRQTCRSDFPFHRRSDNRRGLGVLG